MKLITICLCFTVVASVAFAADQQIEKAKDAMISAQVEFAKAKIDSKCQKIRKKIKVLEDKLSSVDARMGTFYDRNDNSGLHQKRAKLLGKIKKQEDKIDSLKTAKMALGAVDFKPF